LRVIPQINRKEKITTQMILEQMNNMFFEDGIEEAIEETIKIYGQTGDHYSQLGRKIMVCRFFAIYKKNNRIESYLNIQVSQNANF
jgi:hypothetical protein